MQECVANDVDAQRTLIRNLAPSGDPASGGEKGGGARAELRELVAAASMGTMEPAPPGGSPVNSYAPRPPLGELRGLQKPPRFLSAGRGRRVPTSFEILTPRHVLRRRLAPPRRSEPPVVARGASFLPSGSRRNGGPTYPRPVARTHAIRRISTRAGGYAWSRPPSTPVSGRTVSLNLHDRISLNLPARAHSDLAVGAAHAWARPPGRRFEARVLAERADVDPSGRGCRSSKL